MSGLGAAPLAIPVVYAVGAVLTAGVLAYLIGMYSSESESNLQSSMSLLSEISKDNPELAKILANNTIVVILFINLCLEILYYR